MYLVKEEKDVLASNFGVRCPLVELCVDCHNQLSDITQNKGSNHIMPKKITYNRPD